MWPGEDPTQLAPLPVHRPRPKSQAGAWEVGVPCLLPLLTAHTEAPPPSPPQGTHEMAL